MTLQDFFTQYPHTALAFSGGCDSAYLLYQAARYGKRIHAYYMDTPFQPAFELEDAKKFCRQYRIPLTILQQDVCQIPDIVKNDCQRCYYCKQVIFSGIIQTAVSEGYSILLDGTNASDDVSDRPGMKALAELQVLSPLRLCGLTKSQIRSHSRELGLFTHNKPAYACLATRIPFGVPITQPDLKRIESCETILFKLGFKDFRIRIFHGAAKIQVPKEQFPQICNLYAEITNLFKPYFTDILFDLVPRKTE